TKKNNTDRESSRTPNYEADERRTENEISLDPRQRSVQKLHGISRRSANGQTGRSHRLGALGQTSSCFARCRIRSCSVTSTAGISCLKQRANCELYCSVRISSRDALSEINTRRFAHADFPFVFRNTDCERVDVPAKLRLAIPSHL